MRSPDEQDIAAELKLRFTYHPPRAETLDVFESIRLRAYRFAEDLVEMVPDCRERSLALTKLEEVVMWANAGIARRG